MRIHGNSSPSQKTLLNKRENEGPGRGGWQHMDNRCGEGNRAGKEKLWGGGKGRGGEGRKGGGIEGEKDPG